MTAKLQEEDLLLRALKKYYTLERINIIVDIIEGNGFVSLRLIDWYVTNYCKARNIVYTKPDGVYFNVYLNYRSQLKAFKKVQFDPFRRRDRIHFEYGVNGSISTTIGQLNFFKWAIENHVLDNIYANLKNIESDMNTQTKHLLKHMSKLGKENCCAHQFTSGHPENISSSIKNMTTFQGCTRVSFE